jgi:tetratricopeptide (TPR) repeat protein
MLPAGSQQPIATRLARAQARLAAGDLHEASTLALELIRSFPDDPRPWTLMGSVHLQAERHDLAVVCLERAVERAPADPAAMIRYGQCLARLGRRAQALAAAQAAAALRLDSAALADGLGTLLTHCDEPARALPLFQRAVAAAPGNAAYLFNLATAQRMAGELESAEASLDAVIAAQPQHCAACYTRADLRTQTPERNHVAALRALLQAGSADRTAQTMLHFALAKELEDLGKYAESFEQLSQGCDLRRAAMQYDVAEDIATLDRIVASHDAAALATGAGHDDGEAIFIIGLPRSGTTLVESILAAHSEVQAGGELPAFPQACIEAVQAQSGAMVPKLEFVQRALAIDPRELGQRYIAATRPQTGSRPRFTDKLPLNYLYAGLIRRALPRARLVALMRDPMDSCYAMYKALFTGAYPFSYDLDDLGRYHLAWQRLMRHWRSVLGDALLVVDYEALVTDQETVTRRILDHCGLPWQQACLEFHGRAGAVATASAAQVRRPLYRSSIGKWRHYEQQLRPLARYLSAPG